MRTLRLVDTKRGLEAALYVFIMVVSMMIFKNSGLAHPDWTYPYFSGAEHLDSLTRLQCSVEGYYKFRALSPAEMFAYDFRSEAGTDLKPCSFNDIGFVFVVFAAKHLFPFLTHINATVALQGVVHVLLTLIIAFSIKRPAFRAVFVLGYGANPLIVHFVTFAYSYFWQVLPSFLFIQLIRDPRRRVGFFALMYPVLYFSYLVRPSVLPLIALVCLYALMSADRRMRVFHAAMGVILAFAIAQAWQPKAPWHTMYVGLGAYQNKHMNGLTDVNGYAVYKNEKNIDVTSSLFDSTFYNADARADYYQTMKKHYLEILRTDYGLVIGNAAKNLAQSFSVGYLVKHPQLRVISMLGGIVVLILLLYSRQYLLVLAILTSSIGFVLYYPPIPAYMFGSYLLLAFGAVRILETATTRGRPPSEAPLSHASGVERA